MEIEIKKKIKENVAESKECVSTFDKFYYFMWGMAVGQIMLAVVLYFELWLTLVGY